MSSVAGGIDAIEAVFDDGSLVADAGLLLAGTVMSRLGLEALIDDTVRLGGLAGAGAGRKVLSLVASMLVGGRCIDDTDRLRSGASGAVLGFGVVAPSTAGSFLRSFTFGHVRQLDKAAEHALARAWSVGAAPDIAEMTVDLDSTVCEVCGKAKHGAAYGHTKVLGYHPLVAVRADTGEVLHSRMRSGSSQRGNVRFARETLARVRRLARDASVTVRADSGFFSRDPPGLLPRRSVAVQRCDPARRNGPSLSGRRGPDRPAASGSIGTRVLCQDGPPARSWDRPMSTRDPSSYRGSVFDRCHAHGSEADVRRSSWAIQGAQHSVVSTTTRGSDPVHYGRGRQP